MKRSRIHDIMAAADDMIRSHGIASPPFAYWTPKAFRARRDSAPKPHPSRQWRLLHGAGAALFEYRVPTIPATKR